MATPLQSIRGFRDLYPQDKVLQNYVFEKLMAVATLYGFENYDGPLLEPIELYLDKSSRELVEEQTFRVEDKKGQVFVMRPEMTPTLARMVANKAAQLTFPLKLFNLGLRYRYEAPQKGREREFYQADFDILGSDNILADAEILACAIQIFLNLGATENDFVLYLNSRTYLEKKFVELEINETIRKNLLNIIDKKDKVEEAEFLALLKNVGLVTKQISSLNTFLQSEIQLEDDPYFSQLFKLLKLYGVDRFCKINLNIVRGLDYYTGIVFEVKEIGSMRRSLLGGGRYDNLVSSYNPNLQIPGVGFAASDVVLLEFIKDKNLLTTINPKSCRYLVTVFNEDTIKDSLLLLQNLRLNNVPSEIYLNGNKKLDKQLKYADKNNIPFVIIIGPEEIKKGMFILKDMKTADQKEIPINSISSLT